MPYTPDSDNLPDAVQSMSDDQRGQWVAVYNAAFEACRRVEDASKDCDAVASQAAYGAINRRDGKAVGDASQLAALVANIEMADTLTRLSERFAVERYPHISLLYAPEGGLTNLPASLPPPDEAIALDWLDVWAVEDGTRYALVLRPTQMPAWLRIMQAKIYQAAHDADVPISPLHVPESFKPHLTLAYSDHPITDLPPIKPLLLTPSMLQLQLSQWGTILDIRELGDDRALLRATTGADALEWGDVVGLKRALAVVQGHDLETPFEDRAVGFKVLAGRRWMAWYTNAYKDRDDEFFQLDKIKQDVDYMRQTGDYPELWFAHLRGTKHGQTTAVWVQGRFAIAVGTFDESPLADALMKYYRRHPRKISHGFWYDRRQKHAGVYGDFHTYEISTLRRGRESNPYTHFGSDGVSPMTIKLEDLKEFMDAVGDAELATRALEAANINTKELDEAGVAHKMQGGQKMPMRMEEEPDSTATINMEDRITRMESTLEKIMAHLTQGNAPTPEETKTQTTAALKDAKTDAGASAAQQQIIAAKEQAASRMHQEAAPLDEQRKGALTMDQLVGALGTSGDQADLVKQQYGEAGMKAFQHAGLGALIGLEER